MIFSYLKSAFAKSCNTYHNLLLPEGGRAVFQEDLDLICHEPPIQYLFLNYRLKKDVEK